MTRYKCPKSPEMEIDGCGFEFEGEPDDEGIVDCPECGMWFTPAKEPYTILSGEEE